MFRSNSTSSEASNPSVGIQYEMEDESQENRNCESTDFVCSDTDADSNADIKVYFDEPIADEIIFKKRVRGFEWGFQTKRNYECTRPRSGRVLLLFRGVWNSQSNTKYEFLKQLLNRSK